MIFIAFSVSCHGSTVAEHGIWELINKQGEFCYIITKAQLHEGGSTKKGTPL